MESGNIKLWLKANEFKINVVLLLLSVIVFAAAILLNNGLLAGAGLLAIIFFATYTIFGYVRANGLGPE